MRYSDLLREYIEKSNLSLTQISDSLRERGYSTHKGHISKLQNGKLPPASEELSRALAEITGGDPYALIIAAYEEKAPEEVKKIFNEIARASELTNNTIKCFVTLITDRNGNLLDNIRGDLIEELKKNGVVVNDEHFIRNSNELYELLEDAGIEEKLQILEVLQELALRNNLALSDLLGPNSDSHIVRENNFFKGITITSELSEFFNDLRDLPPHEQKDIIEQALTYLYGKKARNRLS
ncbi:helix-turn-helix domain-containing protein [Brevibacterium sp. JNUCC-42]|nr:helix-turn-helix domain-containing protein [Brevibacterium sp. JNUCC-42]